MAGVVQPRLGQFDIACRHGGQNVVQDVGVVQLDGVDLVGQRLSSSSDQTCVDGSTQSPLSAYRPWTKTSDVLTDSG
ncbi:MAG: hypothetical protein M9886_12000 [Candidatus Nanopelagicales bacterium]|nr:hypothetical protein [Candidatus Nanopelagicales bacterium]